MWALHYLLKYIAGADPGFQAKGGVLKKIAPSGGRRENFGVFRVKNHDFTPKNHIFSNFRGRPPLYPPLDCIGSCQSSYHTITATPTHTIIINHGVHVILFFIDQRKTYNLYSLWSAINFIELFVTSLLEAVRLYM